MAELLSRPPGPRFNDRLNSGRKMTAFRGEKKVGEFRGGPPGTRKKYKEWAKIPKVTSIHLLAELIAEAVIPIILSLFFYYLIQISSGSSMLPVKTMAAILDSTSNSNRDADKVEETSTEGKLRQKCNDLS